MTRLLSILDGSAVAASSVGPFLRGSLLLVNVLLIAREVEGGEGRHGSAPTLSAEASLRVKHGGRNPAQDHRSSLPALDVSGVPDDPAVEVLDRVRAPQRPVQRSRHPQALDSERLVNTRRIAAR
jgi:hypothetical protein